MKIALLGASGKTGSLLLRQALEEGHEVTAFVRNAKRLADLVHPKLRIVEGQADDPMALRKAVEGSEVVISTLGQAKGSSQDLLERTVQALVPIMKNAGVKRLVSLIGAGVSDERDKPDTFGRKFMVRVMRLFVPHVLDDATRHAAIVKSSGLDYTLVRPPRLLDAPAKGKIDAGYLSMGPNNKIARADVARFMLSEAVKPRFVNESPMITW